MLYTSSDNFWGSHLKPIDAIIPIHINYIHVYDNFDIMTKKNCKIAQCVRDVELKAKN